MELEKITSFLNDEFSYFKGEDDSCNGLQVEGKKEVKKIAYAVDACVEVFERAAKEKADLVLVHHGLFWEKALPQRITHTWKKRLAPLIKNDISLIAYHLPLDAHPKFGNTALLANMMDLKKQEWFGEYHGAPICLRGEIKPQSIHELATLAEKKLGCKTRIIDFGPKTIRRLGIGTGGSAYAAYGEDSKIDCMITGEVKHSDYQYLKEAGVSVIAAGHYKTEISGVSALAEILGKKFGLETVFIDEPTGL